jgi:hypothetical protein
MANPSKAKGTAWESKIVAALQRAGWPYAERRTLSGAQDKGDIAGIPGWVIEAKNCRELKFGPWLTECHREAFNVGPQVEGAVWAKRRGFPEAEDGFVVMNGETFLRLLKSAGY